MATVYAKQTFGIGRPSGGATVVTKGDVYDDSHPIVKAKPGLFAAEPSRVVGRDSAPVVETATRAPGERRRTPRKRAPESP